MIFLVLLPASLCDLYQYRVPNPIICVGLALSLYKNLWLYGIQGILYFSVNSLIPFVVCFIFYRLHMFGAGDIKLFSIISSYFNLRCGFRAMIVSLFIGALFSFVKIILQKNFICRFRHLTQYMKNWMAGQPDRIYYDFKKQGEEGVIPFTICILLAVIICMGGE